MTRNVAASVHRRLLNRARAEGRPFDEVLQYFALERLLYRLGRSPFADRFVLKGALMLSVWQGPFTRPTRDVDLLGRLENKVGRIAEVFRAVCREPVPEDDGLRFHDDSVAAERIADEAEYQGVRLRLLATLGEARIRVQIDIGFGDVLVPGPTRVRLPALLEFPAPELSGYSRESTIAEKFQAMVYLGAVNSRMKDFYDVWFLASRFAFDGPILARAVRETFHRRRTDLPAVPFPFGEAIARSDEKQAQWAAFLRRLPAQSAPAELSEAIQVIGVFLEPVTLAMNEGRSFEKNWSPGGPWR